MAKLFPAQCSYALNVAAAFFFAMICFVALIVFGILGIFSAKYREIAREAFSCVFLKMTLRKCDSRLDERLRAQ